MDLHVQKSDLAVHRSESGRLPSGIPDPLRKASCRFPCFAAQRGGLLVGLSRPEVAFPEGGVEGDLWRTVPPRPPTLSVSTTTTDDPGRHRKSLRLAWPPTPIWRLGEKKSRRCEGFRTVGHIGAGVGDRSSRGATDSI